jgi:hypothetical protein
MSRVITFSRNFPKYHPNAGEPTYFVEKLWSSINDINISKVELPVERENFCFGKFEPKHHTIRVGNRWKVGDKFSPRVWSGKPYNSKQIIIAGDVEIKQIWNIEIKQIWNIEIKVEGNGRWHTVYLNGKNICHDTVKEIAKNDGLDWSELLSWFNKSFTGQIICWNGELGYV